jgi:uncharacterized integral membrane protein
MSGDTSSAERSIRTRQTIRLLVWVLVVVLVVVFALVNTQDVTVDWLFGDGEMSLWVVIAVSAALGFVAGWFAHWRRRD